MTRPSIGQILDSMVSKDKDHRYMAISDLQGQLAKPEFRVSDQEESRICKVVLQQLDDGAGDISGLAVKCLGPLVTRVKEGSVETILTQLCNKMLQGKSEQQRDLASIGLKGIVSEASVSLAGTLSSKLTPKLVAGIDAKEPLDLVSDSLEIANEVLQKFGNSMQSQLPALTESLLRALQDHRASVRKKATHCLAALALYLPDEQLDALTDQLLGTLRSPSLSSDHAQTYVHTVGAISRAVGWRFGKHLGAAVPLVIQFLTNAEEGSDELQEYCLQSLELMVLAAPNDAKGFYDVLFPVVLSALSYDPNYTESMEDDEEEEDAEEDELSEDGYSDDEDTSWKVRRAAAKAVSAVVQSFPELLPSIFPQAAPALVARFREREETVKADIFSTFTDLIRQVGQLSLKTEEGAQAAAQLLEQCPAIIKASAKQLHDKAARTRAGMFQVLNELVTAAPMCCTADTVALLENPLKQAIGDKQASREFLKISALTFMRLGLATASAQAWQPHLPSLGPLVVSSMGERYYKVAAEALHTGAQMVHVIRPQPPAQPSAKLQGLVGKLFSALLERLSASQQDQEVKDAGIGCAGACVARLGDTCPQETTKVLQLLLERLNNDITRLAAVKAVEQIAMAPLPLPLGSMLGPSMQLLTSFLRKSSRPLRQASLCAIKALVAKYGGELEQGHLHSLLEELALLVSDADLLLTAMALSTCTTLLLQQPGCAGAVSTAVMPPALRLVQSQLLQGAAMDALQGFLVSLQRSGHRATSFQALQEPLLAAGNTPNVSKTCQQAVAQCTAALCQAAGQQATMQSITALLQALTSAQTNEATKRLSLLTIGEIGRTADLSGYPNLRTALTEALGSSSEDIKSAASTALGAVCIGNLGAYMPFLLQQIQALASVPKDQYLLLRALDEALVSLTELREGPARIASLQKQALDLLLSCCEAEEECRLVVAACLGHLALVAPALVLPALQSQVAAAALRTRAAAILAAKFMLTDKPHAMDTLLSAALPAFLEHLSDPEWYVRKSAVQLLSAAAHNKPALILDLLPAALPHLFAQTEKDASLVRVVDLGPFKHRIDDGLELRKAAFEAMDVLLERCSGRLSIPAYMDPLKAGLGDHYDVKMPCHLLLGKLAESFPSHVLAALDSLVPALHATLTARVKQEAVKQEVDRNEDMVRSCLRAVETCARIPSVDLCLPFKQLMQGTVLTGTMAAKYAAVQAERAEAEGIEVTSR